MNTNLKAILTDKAMSTGGFYCVIATCSGCAHDHFVAFAGWSALKCHGCKGYMDRTPYRKVKADHHRVDLSASLRNNGISVYSEAEFEPGAVRVEFAGESYVVDVFAQQAADNWNSGLCALGGGRLGVLLDDDMFAAAFLAVLLEEVQG